MKLKADIDILSFLKDVQKCDGDVFFKTDEGDILNLKSELSQFIFATILNHEEFWRNSEIECTKEEDKRFLYEYVSE